MPLSPSKPSYKASPTVARDSEPFTSSAGERGPSPRTVLLCSASDEHFSTRRNRRRRPARAFAELPDIDTTSIVERLAVNGFDRVPTAGCRTVPTGGGWNGGGSRWNRRPVSTRRSAIPNQKRTNISIRPIFERGTNPILLFIEISREKFDVVDVAFPSTQYCDSTLYSATASFDPDPKPANLGPESNTLQRR